MLALGDTKADTSVNFAEFSSTVLMISFVFLTKSVLLVISSGAGAQLEGKEPVSS
ncbi:Uncharacterised protein [Streptococcus pneumoniae]|nr:Uncharacterised protein [Streptococcus pneumoniae]